MTVCSFFPTKEHKPFGERDKCKTGPPKSSNFSNATGLHTVATTLLTTPLHRDISRALIRPVDRLIASLPACLQARVLASRVARNVYRLNGRKRRPVEPRPYRV